MGMKDKVKQYVCDYFEKFLLPACYDSMVDFFNDDIVVTVPTYEEYVQRVHDRMTGEYPKKDDKNEENQ